MRDQQVAAAVGSGSLRKIIKQGFDQTERDLLRKTRHRHLEGC